MKRRILHFIGILLLFVSTVRAEDLGGMSIKFTPESVKPGDLVTLWIQMNREDYAEFDLDIPSHPQLHLVSREQIAPALINGQYYQGERLMLQPLSSSEIKLAGVSVELTEASGPRTVELPEITLTVLPFQSDDEASNPEELPEPAAKKMISPSVFIPLFCMVAGAFVLILLIRLKLNLPTEPEANSDDEKPNFASILRAATISNEDLEAILNSRGDELSDELRGDLEIYLYAPEHDDSTRSSLHQRLREELDA